MALLVTFIAAIIVTLIWYKRKNTEEKDAYKTVALVYMYWGASLMWFVDLIVELVHDGAAVFYPGEDATLEEWQLHFYAAMNDLALGIAVVALALAVWLIIVLISDPKGLFRNKK